MGRVDCNFGVGGSQTHQRQNKPEATRLNPAINRLSGDGMGGVGGSRSGSAGAVSPGRRTPGGNAGSSSGINTSRSMGSSGVNTSRSMGSSGINTSR